MNRENPGNVRKSFQDLAVDPHLGKTSLHVNITHEGVIMDVIIDGDVAYSLAMTAAEWAHYIMYEEIQ